MTIDKPKPNRRMGPPGSENWTAMLDGAEDILREEGHAALTSRRIAERIGVKQRLVYYYFHTMDDLIVETFRRLANADLARLHEAAKAPKPFTKIWDASVRTTDSRLISEFMALANRIDGLRGEVIRFIEEVRAIQVRAITEAMTRNGIKSALPPAALAIVATSVALSVSREAQIGVHFGHDDIMSVIETFIATLEA